MVKRLDIRCKGRMSEEDINGTCTYRVIKKYTRTHIKALLENLPKSREPVQSLIICIDIDSDEESKIVSKPLTRAHDS